MNNLVRSRLRELELEERLFTANWKLASACESACSYRGRGGGGGGSTLFMPPSRSATAFLLLILVDNS